MFVKRVTLVGLVALFACFLPMNLHAMERQFVQLMPSNETGMLPIPGDKTVQSVSITFGAATLSQTINDYISHYGYSMPMPCPIDERTLKAIVNSMHVFYEQQLSWQEKLEQIRAAVERQHITFADFFYAVDYLGIDVLKAPLADVVIQSLHQECNGSKYDIEHTILSFMDEKEFAKMGIGKGKKEIDEYANFINTKVHSSVTYKNFSEMGGAIPVEFANLLAKYWFLNYGNAEEKNFMFPEASYGFSIAELLYHDKLPAFWGPRGMEMDRSLDLSRLKINDATGLNAIPGIASVFILNLSNNQLKSLVPENFRGRLMYLVLSNNQLVRLDPNVFSNLKFNEIDLHGNPLDKAQVDALRKRFGNRIEL